MSSKTIISENENLINYNGKLISSNVPVFAIDNRAFRYGDGMFESIRIIDGEMPLYQLHFPRLTHACQMLKLEMDKKFTDAYFKNEILKIAKAKGLTENSRARLSIFRTAGGYYLPKSSKAEFIIEIRPLTENGFELNKNGFKIDLYADVEKPVSKLSSFKTCNALIYVLAALHRKENGLDDCMLINWKSRIVESIDSNIFIVKDSVVHTPPLAEGCVAGVMRDYMLQLMTKLKIEYTEMPLTLEEVFTADEMFLTNAIHGLKWVSEYKSKKYELNFALKLSSALNRELLK
jgi:branched-subunit amino acid aminotransferase/4-amino-4-deoxychorismate lyase